MEFYVEISNGLVSDEEGDNVCYSILWLPDRLLHLNFHLYFVLPVLGVYILYQMVKKTRFPRSKW